MSELLPLFKRKMLCARLSAWQSLGPHRASMLSGSAEKAYTALETDLITLTADAKDSPADISLDTFLKGDILPQIKAVSHWTGKHSALLNPLLQPIETDIGKISCAGCTPIIGEICRDGEFDELIIEGGGHCLSVLKNMLDQCFITARDYYRQLATSSIDHCLPTVQLRVTDLNKKPHSFPNAFWVTGVTKFHDEGGRFVSEVVLKLNIEKFDLRTYLACLYVLMHECMCHVFQGILTTHSPRSEADPSDRFAEGWLDFIAVSALGISLADFEQEQAGKEYHESRLTLGTEASFYSKRWAHGRQAGRKLLYLLENLLEGNVSPVETFWGISFDLNLQSYSSQERELLVAKVDRYLPLRHQRPDPKYPEFVALVVKYLKHKDIDGFLRSVLQL